jgi:hypothetical protein
VLQTVSQLLRVGQEGQQRGGRAGCLQDELAEEDEGFCCIPAVEINGASDFDERSSYLRRRW